MGINFDVAGGMVGMINFGVKEPGLMSNGVVPVLE